MHFTNKTGNCILEVLKSPKFLRRAHTVVLTLFCISIVFLAISIRSVNAKIAKINETAKMEQELIELYMDDVNKILINIDSNKSKIDNIHEELKTLRKKIEILIQQQNE